MGYPKVCLWMNRMKTILEFLTYFVAKYYFPKILLFLERL